ncbi:MAG: Na/Pi cotransporter family protein, partial [Methyloprofundus sp.]|nr:Na/Pi cotransporter family protein [Methyloprofundus sp.]
QFMLLVDVIAEHVRIANDDYTLKLAIFHSLFNLVGVVLMLPFINKMVAVLEKFLKGEQVKVDEPRYLNDAAMAFPDTVVLAVHQETVRLYKHASHIILKTIGLSSRGVFSDKELAQLLQEHSKISPYNVDAAYERNIKGIYSAIIAFIGQADFTWEMQQSSSLYWLRAANRHIVEAIKDTKHLQKNLLRLALSNNNYVKGEYEKVRYQIAELFRELEVFRLQSESETQEIALLSFDVFKVKIKEQDQQMNAGIDCLIRERKITPEAGTSLINDSAYMYAIKKHLLDMAETVFVIQEEKISKAQRELVLSDEELVGVLRTDN